MGYYVSPEREKELIEKTARFIVDNDLASLADIFLAGTVPTGELVGQAGYIFLFPWLSGIFGKSGLDFVNMFGLDYRKNGKALLERVDELEKEREDMKAKRTQSSILSRLKKRFSSKKTPAIATQLE